MLHLVAPRCHQGILVPVKGIPAFQHGHKFVVEIVDFIGVFLRIHHPKTNDCVLKLK